MESAPQIAMPAQIRCLLSKLRDLNLSGHRVALDGGRWVSVEGCTSLDASAEVGVRYLLALADGSQNTLALRWREGKLDLDLRDPSGSVPGRSLRVDVAIDGPTTSSRALSTRVRPEAARARDLEHVLRRIVRSVFA